MSDLDWELWHEEQQARKEAQFYLENPDLDYDIENPDEDSEDVIKKLAL